MKFLRGTDVYCRTLTQHAGSSPGTAPPGVGAGGRSADVDALRRDRDGRPAEL